MHRGDLRRQPAFSHPEACGSSPDLRSLLGRNHGRQNHGPGLEGDQ